MQHQINRYRIILTVLDASRMDNATIEQEHCNTYTTKFEAVNCARVLEGREWVIAARVELIPPVRSARFEFDPWVRCAN